MKYIVETRENGVPISKKMITADNPKTATLTSINQILKTKPIDIVEVLVDNKDGKSWRFVVEINHKNRQLKIIKESKRN